MNTPTELDSGVTLPESGIIDTEWARTALNSAEMFSASHLSFAKGSVFTVLKLNLGDSGYKQSVLELEYTVETAEKYINYLELRPVITAIKDKYYVALSLSASEVIPDSVEDALALCDITIAKYGKLTKDNLTRALENTGQTVKKLSQATLETEAAKKKALNEWLLEEHSLSLDDIHVANIIKTEGKTEFTEKMIEAYGRLDDYGTFITTITPSIVAADNTQLLRFLSDITDASGAIMEYIQSERANTRLNQLKDTFSNDVYPKQQHAKEQ